MTDQSLPVVLPPAIADWYAARGWKPHAHQLAVVQQAQLGRSVLLIAPTGGGKTLAGFLPALAELAHRPPSKRRVAKLHTLYISPLKALAADIARNLETPVAEMGLQVRIETRTGDTSQARRGRQRTNPPDLLLTTPEQLALMLSYRDAHRIFGDLQYVVLDELHAMTNSKRGDLLSLGLARLHRLAPAARFIGLSATVADPGRLRRYLGEGDQVATVMGRAGAAPVLDILASAVRIPWAGHSARHALPDVYDAIRRNKTVLVFVNTRSQAEVVFQELWKLNDDNLPIALHHGSLDLRQRRKVEAAMVAGTLRAIVCTSTLDLGIDWGGVDLVVQIGAPKGIARTVQRIGRANHRIDEQSRALLVPANRFEVLECHAAIGAIAEGHMDAEEPRPGELDVLAQHVLGVACAAPFRADDLYAEVRFAAPYADLTRADFDQVLDFVGTGGYSLRQYERYRKLRQGSDGRWDVAHPGVSRQYRLNVGTIVESPMLRVKLRRGRNLGEVEEWFIEQLVPGDTFAFAGEVLRFEGIRDMVAEVSRSRDPEPKVPSYQGGKFPLSTFLASRVRKLLADPAAWSTLPAQLGDWLRIQQRKSTLPKVDQLLVETFPRGQRHFMVAYPFEGRLAHQTLGMLLTRRMHRAGLRPLGFLASEYAVAVWSLKPATEFDDLFSEDMLGDDLDAWMAESNLVKRSFRNVAIIAGLIDRRHPGQEKNRRQVTFSSDIIYEVLRKFEPDHILLKATWADAARGLLDVQRLADTLARVRGHIVHRDLQQVSPLAVPVLLDIGREAAPGRDIDEFLGSAAELIEDAMQEPEQD